MPQILGAILAIIVLVWLVAIAVWIVQWAVAVIVWVFQSILLPILIFLLPAVIALTVLAGFYWGSWAAAKNYFNSVRTHVNPEGHLGSVIRRSVIGLQTVTLAVSCAVFTAASTAFIYASSMKGFDYIQGYYAAIEFPYFNIVFPFWRSP